MKEIKPVKLKANSGKSIILDHIDKIPIDHNMIAALDAIYEGAKIGAGYYSSTTVYSPQTSPEREVIDTDYEEVKPKELTNEK